VAADSPNHRGEDGRLLCRGATSVVEPAGGRLQLITVLSGISGNAGAGGDMKGLSAGVDTT